MMSSASFGLKVWSCNKNYIPAAQKLYGEGYFNYIEIYAFPGTEEETSYLWKALDIPFVVHAPHFMHGLNFSDKEKYLSNIKMMESALSFADKLNAETVIFHPGIKGDYRETARQMKNIKDGRIVVENKPYRIAKAVNGLKPSDICVGYCPYQISHILSETGIGFCLDIGHAICAANGAGEDKIKYLKDFIALSPKMFHLSDGEWSGAIDKHYNIGKGDYDFETLRALMPESPKISIETEKASQNDLEDFKEDVRKLRAIFAC